MTDISQKTWKYLHGPDDVTHLSFKTGGVPRSFTAIQYAATERNEIDLNDDGIALIDNDQMCVVLDGHLKNNPEAQASFMSDVRKMSWSDLAAMALNHPRYRGSQDDFHLKRPNSGVLVNQIQRGVLHAPTTDEDLRSPSMVAAHINPDCAYRFPEAGRARMISEILQHNCLQGDDGAWRLVWDITPSKDAIPSGRLDAPEEQISAWDRHWESNPEISHQILGELTEPYFSGQIGTFPKTDAGRYGFCGGGMSNPAMLCLETIDGEMFSFSSRGDFGRFLDQLPDPAIRDVWKLVQVVDHDLSTEEISTLFKHRIAEMKEEFERSRDASLDLHLSPV
ncbi:hypothetical protein LCGC14_0043840 [marine sediment metagenome]|uniref:Uncharacterized protein n=2 Tax=root TaxID=1 RepID=A0A7V1BHZ4_9RHOB|nr:hypothetical protein [Sulfitobacter litoralis]HDZ53439.1 hypothetical protein [Sulfitobacter litoralis]